MEFVGRVDGQVKVRGHRIELGEVEAALCSHPWVAQAAAIVQEGQDGEKRLVGYVVGEVAGDVDPRQLRQYLRERVPEYMVPNQLVVLAELPLNANGKLDRKALPEVVAEERAGEYVAARTPVEEVLTAIWCEVLELELVGIEDEFFDLGGHSLLVMKAVYRMREIFPVDLPMNLIFHARTIAALAEYIESAGAVLDIDVSVIAGVLMRMNDLSEYEVEAMLAARVDVMTEAAES
jgi:acyl carrier protein